MTKDEKRLVGKERMRKWRLNNPEKNRDAQKRSDAKPERKEKKRKRMAKWRELNPLQQKQIAKKSYVKRADIINSVRRKTTDELSDEYVIDVLRKQTKYSLNVADISKELIELKRSSLQIKRQIKNKIK